MKLRRDSHLESTGVLAVGDRGGRALTGGLHVRDDVGNQVGDAFERRTLGLVQVGQGEGLASVQTLPVIPAWTAGIQTPWRANREGGLNAYKA